MDDYSISPRLQALEQKIGGCTMLPLTDGLGMKFLVPSVPLGGPVTLSAGAAITPFSVILGAKTTSGVQLYGVQPESFLFLSLVPWDSLAITGLLSTQAVDDPGWFAASPGDDIWLEVTVSGNTATAATIKHGAAFTGASAWSTGSYVEQDGASPPSQTLARRLLGTLDATGAIRQATSTHLLMRWANISGRPALYPMPL